MAELLKGLSIVVPVYNGELSLPELAQRVCQSMLALGQDFELILVDDASQDGSWNVIQSLVATIQQVKGFRFSKNYGQHNALLCGIRAARYSICVTMDDDLEHAPEHIGTLLDRLNQGADVVYGSPIQHQRSAHRDFGSMAIRLALAHVLGVRQGRFISAFRVFKTRLRDTFSQYSGPFVSIDALLNWGTTHFNHVPVQFQQRKHGSSNYNIIKLMGHAVDIISGFSVIPLRSASLMGLMTRPCYIVLETTGEGVSHGQDSL